MKIKLSKKGDDNGDEEGDDNGDGDGDGDGGGFEQYQGADNQDSPKYNGCVGTNNVDSS